MKGALGAESCIASGGVGLPTKEQGPRGIEGNTRPAWTVERGRFSYAMSRCRKPVGYPPEVLFRRLRSWAATLPEGFRSAIYSGISVKLSLHAPGFTSETA